MSSEQHTRASAQSVQDRVVVLPASSRPAWSAACTGLYPSCDLVSSLYVLLLTCGGAAGMLTCGGHLCSMSTSSPNWSRSVDHALSSLSDALKLSSREKHLTATRLFVVQSRPLRTTLNDPRPMKADLLNSNFPSHMARRSSDPISIMFTRRWPVQTGRTAQPLLCVWVGGWGSSCQGAPMYGRI